ncbi:MAG TPA: YncE family protein [Anaerolineae bacterium]
MLRGTDQNSMPQKALSLFPRSLLLIFLFLTAHIYLHRAASPSLKANSQSTAATSLYLPLLFTDWPIPQVVATIPLPGASCPNDIGANPVSGLVYVANHDSSNVSILQATTFVKNVATGEWPTRISSAPDSARTAVTNLHGPVSVFDQESLVASLPTNPPPVYGEPYAAAFNPVNGYLYVTNVVGSVVQVFDQSYNSIANVELNAGWILDVDVDPQTGLVYVISVEDGHMYVISGTQHVDTFRLGWGPFRSAIDPIKRTIYSAHAAPNSVYPHNLSIFDIDSKTVTPLSTAATSRNVAVNTRNGNAYATNPDDDSVTILQGTNVVATLPVGAQPWDVAVNPNSGYAFVTNLADNTVTILRGDTVIGTLPTGRHPTAITVDTLNNVTYVANCADASVTVLR